MNKDNNYSTTDLTLAAFLRVEGFVLRETYRDGGPVRFVFSDPESKAESKALEYYDSPHGKYAYQLINQYRLLRGVALDIKAGIA